MSAWLSAKWTDRAYLTIKYLLSLPTEDAEKTNLRNILLRKSCDILDLDLFELLYVEGQVIDLKQLYIGILRSSNVELCNEILKREDLTISPNSLYKISNRYQLEKNCDERILNLIFDKVFTSWIVFIGSVKVEKLTSVSFLFL